VWYFEDIDFFWIHDSRHFESGGSLSWKGLMGNDIILWIENLEWTVKESGTFTGKIDLRS
jgi:hypothetical protein